MNVRNSGAIIDTNGFDVNLGHALTHSIEGGDNATDGGLTKSGSGALTLPGTNTYTGATSINAGSLLITGNSIAATGTVTVASGATLGGTGTTGGAITLSAGGILAPGTGTTTTGTLSTGAVTMNATSIYSINLNSTSPANDRVTSTGAVVCAGTLTIASFVGSTARTYTIASGTSVSGEFASKVNGSVFTEQGRDFQISYTSTIVTLTDVTGVSATTKTWDGGGSDNNWTTAANWVGDLAPLAGDALVFAGSVRLAPNNNYAAATSFASITFDNTADLFVIGGNQITLAGNVTNNDTQLQTMNVAMDMAATRTVNAASGPMTLSGVLSGAGGVQKLGNQRLTLSATNSYSGDTSVSAGALRADRGVGLPVAGNLNLAGGVLETGADITTTDGSGAGQIRLTADGAGFSAIGGADVTINLGAGAMSLPGGGGGTLLLNTTDATQNLILNKSLTTNVRSYLRVDSPTYPARLTASLTSGGANVVFGKTGVGNLIVAGGWTVTGSCHPTIYAGTLTIDAGTVTIPTTEDLVIGRNDATHGTVGGTVVINTGSTVTAGGVLLANSAGTSTGTLHLDGGTLTVSRIYRGSSSGAATLYWNGGTVRASDTTNASAFLSGLTNVFIKAGGAIIDDQNLSGITIGSALLTDVSSTGGGLTKQGNGSVILNGASTYTGATTVSAGTLSIGDGTTLGSIATSANIVNNAALIYNNPTATTYANVISGTGTLTKSGAGTLGLSGANTFTGGVTVNAGFFVPQSSSTGPAGNPTNGPCGAGTAPLILAGGQMRATISGDTTVGNVVTISADTTFPTIASEKTLTFAGPVTLSGGTRTLTVQAGSTVAGKGVVCSGAIGDGGNGYGVSKSGAGTLTLSGANTFSGATSVNGGSLFYTGDSSAATGAVSVASGATLGGTGTIGGAVTVAIGGVLSPGVSSAATVTLSKASATALTLDAGSTLAMTLDTVSDRVTCSGASSNIVLGGTLAVTCGGGFSAGSYTLASCTGGISGSFSSITFSSTGYAATVVLDNVSATKTATLVVTNFNVTARQTIDTGLVVNDGIFDVYLTESGSPDTNVTPVVQVTDSAPTSSFTSLRSQGTTSYLPVEGAGTAATDTAKPVLLSSLWTDVDGNGVDAGDTLVLTFSENVTSASMVVADLGLPVISDSLDTSTIADKSAATPTITVELAGAPLLSPGNTYASGTLGAGKPSGIYLTASGATHLSDQAMVPNAGLVGTNSSAVDVGASPSSLIRIEWNDTHDTITKTWALGALDLGATVTSSTYTILNAGHSTVSLTAVSTNSAAWTIQSNAGNDAFGMKANANANPDFELTLSTSTVPVGTFLRSGSLQDFSLEFAAPTTSSTGVSQSITVTITASQY